MREVLETIKSIDIRTMEETEVFETTYEFTDEEEFWVYKQLRILQGVIDNGLGIISPSEYSEVYKDILCITKLLSLDGAIDYILPIKHSDNYPEDIYYEYLTLIYLNNKDKFVEEYPELYLIITGER